MLSEFKSISRKAHLFRSKEAEDKLRLRQSRNRARIWSLRVPTFKIENVKLADLEKRPKNSPPDKKAAERIMEAMETLEADACSARYVDQVGEFAVSVFAFADPGGDKYLASNPQEAKVIMRLYGSDFFLIFLCLPTALSWTCQKDAGIYQTI